MKAEELQLIIEREKWARYEAQQVCATAAGSTPEAKRLEQTWKDLELAGRVSTETVPQVATPAEDGPVLREAKQFAEALRRVRQGDVGEALAPNGNHKLPSHIVYG